MSQFFNIARFGRLFSKHTTEHGGGYLLATGVLLGGLGLVLGASAYLSSMPLAPSQQAAFFILGLFGAGSFFTSTVFALFGDKKQATAALMLPASHSEKYLVGWLYSLPIFLAVYIGCFYLVDSLVLQFDSYEGPRTHLVQLFTGEEKLYTSLVAYAVVNAVFLWGSIFFVKQHFVRTAFGVLLAVVAVIALNFQVMQALVGQELNMVMPFAGMSLHEGKEWYAINLPEAQSGWFGLVPLAMMLLAWAAAYRRVTEKQI
ncbi:hypothetical protein GCM10022409_12800 [Hymenobacter glaciei]|uniref:ABC transporter permease n=1 Tax=Hymenobacter glaciei TaxID=877209 RepID=A0ABP7TSU8_9BACT